MPVDPSANVAATARVHADAQIGPQVVIGEYAVVEQDVVMGAFSRLEPYVYVKRWTTLGERNEISAGTVLGTDPLDKNFKGERSYLRIGNGNIIREHYTISRGTQPESVTEIGDGNYIMTSGHIAHNSQDRQSVRDCELRAGGRICRRSRIRHSFQGALGSISIPRSAGSRWWPETRA